MHFAAKDPWHPQKDENPRSFLCSLQGLDFWKMEASKLLRSKDFWRFWIPMEANFDIPGLVVPPTISHFLIHYWLRQSQVWTSILYGHIRVSFNKLHSCTFHWNRQLGMYNFWGKVMLLCTYCVYIYIIDRSTHTSTHLIALGSYVWIFREFYLYTDIPYPVTMTIRIVLIKLQWVRRLSGHPMLYPHYWLSSRSYPPSMVRQPDSLVDSACSNISNPKVLPQSKSYHIRPKFVASNSRYLPDDGLFCTPIFWDKLQFVAIYTSCSQSNRTCHVKHG